ncbi:MAG: hypothetical protein GC161_08490 [Planctomycetaceae bacterium]|nr:hypothetical protein [Planctomycetaceae bacterium]
MKTSHLLTPFLVALLAATVQGQNRALLMPGDALPGAGNILAVGDFALNAQGSWAALVTTDLFGPFQGVLVRDGQPLVVPGPGSVTPVYATESRFLGIDDFGNVGYYGVNPADSTDWSLMWNQTTLLKRGELIDFVGDGTILPVGAVRVAHLSEDNSGAAYCVLSSDPASGTLRRALVRVARTPLGQLDTRIVLAAGQTLPTGQPAPVALDSAIRFRNQLSTNSFGDLSFSVLGSGVFRYDRGSGQLSTVLQDDAESPLVGKTWNISLNNAVALSDSGATYVLTRLDEPGLGGLQVIARDQQLAVLVIDPFLGLQGFPLTTISSSAAVRVSANNRILWQGGYLDGAGVFRRGLFRDKQAVVLEGQTQVEGHTIDRVSLTSADTHDFTAQADAIVFRARTVQGQTGLFEVRPDSAVLTIPGCFPKQSLLTLLGNLKVGGLALAQLQNSPSQQASGLLFLSPLGSTACGTVLPGVGEVLVDTTPGLLTVLGTSSGASNPQGDAFFFLGLLPPNYAFQGLTFFAQGAWVDPLSAFEPVRVSNALRISVGL